MDNATLFGLAGGAALAFVIGKLLVKVDTKSEDRRKNAIDLSNFAAENGLPLVNKLLKSFAVRDLSGMKSAIDGIQEILRDPDQRKAVLDQFLKTQLDKALKTREGRELVQKAVDDAKKIAEELNAPSTSR